ncbi:hypothetical protein GUJ93_ZPchr0003g17498 [Zizania palustris]|uniref:Leucine-rich repeat-containing N-terminal plant-type domain-containing protein n=1 Tax=Zizania palustris TaxID=103762 RepID=A0A8J5VYC8_ZIZPA|nr:hypothetical protein GUJ93_ZPchr0003g17498 [Zizania palustris]
MSSGQSEIQNCHTYDCICIAKVTKYDELLSYKLSQLSRSLNHSHYCSLLIFDLQERRRRRVKLVYGTWRPTSEDLSEARLRDVFLRRFLEHFGPQAAVRVRVPRIKALALLCCSAAFGLQVAAMRPLVLLVGLACLVLVAEAKGAGAGSVTALDDDVLGLIVFKADVVYHEGRLVTCNEDDERPCAWVGITCDPLTSRVPGLSLAVFSLSGKVVRGLLRLESLQSLSLSRNNLSGDLPTDLGRLPYLQSLDVSTNAFSSAIPLSRRASSATAAPSETSRWPTHSPATSRATSAGAPC